MIHKLIEKFVLWLTGRCSIKGRYMPIYGKNNSGKPHMIRYYLWLTPKIPFRVYIHQFISNDKDDPHDHPWDFWTYRVRGEYTERIFKWNNNLKRLRLDDLKIFGLDKRFYFRKAETIHQVTGISGYPLTVVVAWKKDRSWYFYKPGKRGNYSQVPWRKYLGIEQVGLEKDKC